MYILRHLFRQIFPATDSARWPPQRRCPRAATRRRIWVGCHCAELTIAVKAMAPHPNPAAASASAGLAAAANVGLAGASYGADSAASRRFARNAEPPRVLEGLEAQLARSFPARNAIETARNSTVFIRSGLGVGSGFILDASCHVITSRHVVDIDAPQVASNTVDGAELRARLGAEAQQLQANIVEQMQLRAALAGQPGTNLQVLQLDERIEAMQQELASLPGQLNREGADKGAPKPFNG